MKKILTIIGARPQFIKAAPVSKAIQAQEGLTEILVHTGQHYDANMSDIFFSEMGIPAPHEMLNAGGGSHAEMTGAIMVALEKTVEKHKPDLMLIYGDTNSTLAGALVASKCHIPIAHVEAGLRSFNMKMPEEVNRIVSDRLSAILFSPTGTGVENLKNEGITQNVYKTGDVMYDAALAFSAVAKEKSRVLDEYQLEPGRYFLATLHRQENTDHADRLRNILEAFADLSGKHPFVLPLHPRTQKRAAELGLNHLLKAIRTIEPVGFLDMVALEMSAKKILTDSGGVQKEAYFHGVPCVTLRDQTEWVETVKAGWNVLADVSDKARITEAFQFEGRRQTITEYGKGHAAETIVRLLAECFQLG